jgi:CBS domain-containing protein
MAGRDMNHLPVVQNGIPVGIVSRDAIMRYLEMRRAALAQGSLRAMM